MTACKKLKRGHKFTIEELYQNKNFVHPKEKNLETIFEEPKQTKDGAAVLTSVRKYRRYLDFDPTVGKIQKRKKNAKKCVSKINGKRSRTRSATKNAKLDHLSIILDELSDSDDSLLETTQTYFNRGVKHLDTVGGKTETKNTVTEDKNVEMKNLSEGVEINNTFTENCESSLVERKCPISNDSENCDVEMNNTVSEYSDNTDIEINDTAAKITGVKNRLQFKNDGLANIDNMNKCKKCMVSVNVCVCRLTETSVLEQESFVTEKVTDRAGGSPLKSCITM